MFEKEKLLLVIIAIASVFLLQQGITGFYLMDFNQNTCLTDSDCSNTCCPVYGEEYGICDLNTNCDEVYQATKEVASHHSSLSPSEMKVESRDVSLKQNYVAIGLGVILAIIVVIVAYIERKNEKPKRRSKKK